MNENDRLVKYHVTQLLRMPVISGAFYFPNSVESITGIETVWVSIELELAVVIDLI